MSNINVTNEDSSTNLNELFKIMVGSEPIKYEVISKITPNLYLSGVNAFSNDNADLFRKYNIKHVVCCVDISQTQGYHNPFLMNNNLDFDIFYVPYDDVLEENLWKTNSNLVSLTKINITQDEYNRHMKILTNFLNKPMMEIANSYITGMIKRNETVLVHCMAGISRSASVVIYHLMRTRGWSYETAKKYVASCRGIIRPNNSFEAQLINYERNKSKSSQ